MTRSRFSIAVLMGAVGAAAVDFSAMRSLDPNSEDVLMQSLFATGVMPVASLLILVGLISAAKLLRSGEVSSFVAGFEASGWAMVFAFMTCCFIAGSKINDYTEAIAEMMLRSVLADLGEIEGTTAELIFGGFATVFFSLPQLLVALLGGWLVHRSGLSVRVALRRESDANRSAIHGIHLQEEQAGAMSAHPFPPFDVGDPSHLNQRFANNSVEK